MKKTTTKPATKLTSKLAGKAAKKSTKPTKITDGRKISKILKDVFGLKELRPGQDKTIRALLAGEDVLAIMPTGAGKSLCYQIPALILPGTTIIVSPLLSLMKDQREKMADLDLNAFEINSAIPTSEIKNNLLEVRKGRTEFVYVTPERLTDAEFLLAMKTVEIDLLVIDEAHCISQWGHDFRPAYLGLKDAIKKLGHPPVLALTATATPEAAADIRSQLGLEEMKVINTGTFRENLFFDAFMIEKEEEKKQRLVELLKESEGSRIVYTSTIRTAEEIRDFLDEQGFNVGLYHGKMKTSERRESQESFMSGETEIVVATTAFGLGIDKSDVRAVIHYGLPGSLEAYYQEAGRAGRDGELARCSLLYLKKDKSVQSFFLAGKFPKAEDVTTVLNSLDKHETKARVEFAELKEQCGSLSETKLDVILKGFADQGLLRRTKDDAVCLQRRPKVQDALRVADQYEAKRKGSEEKLKKMVSYAQTALCRWKVFVNYFGENAVENCGQCDNCVHGRSELHLRPVAPPAEKPVEKVVNF
jgi:ATP-dependent DNA helicase RecQ